MPAEARFIGYHDSRLCYFRAGHGPRSLLLFHGFGQDHKAFESWLPELESRYRLFVFDLYFHGQSSWPMHHPIQKDDWKKILTIFREHEKVDVFEVAGFSLGARFALAAVENFRESVSNLMLIAPDGINTNFWYSLATFPFGLRALFKSMVLRPGRFYGLAGFLGKLGLVDRGLLRFAEGQMDTEEKRRRVYFSWVYFRSLRFDLKEIAVILNSRNIPLLMVTGRYDHVTPLRNMQDFLELLVNKRSETLACGHHDLIRESCEIIRRRVDQSAE